MTALVAGALAGPISSDAQDSGPRKSLRIGRLSPLSAEADRPNMQAFRKGLRDLGWVEGRSFTIESRFADGNLDRLPGLAAELVRLPIDLIVTGSTPGALAAKHATSTIPIVMITTSDPVADGIVSSLARPGGNVTGMTALGRVVNAKRLELIKEAVPGVSRIAVLGTAASPYTTAFLKEKDAVARALGLDLRAFEVSDPSGLDRAFAAIAGDGVGAVMVQTDPMLLTHRRQIVALVAKRRLPAVYGEREFVEAGGLMFYGASLSNMYQDLASYADRVLRGTRPADLPVEQPTKLELVVNLKTARALGITIPPAVLVRADRVVER